MEKLEHLARMLNKRTKGKNYENFVVNSIYTKLSNPELIPVTQQYVKNINFKDNKKSYYLLDLYFPQLKYGIEVDESHHLNKENQINDKVRAENILNAVQCEQGRIAIFNKDGSLKKYDEIETQINKEVEIIKSRISELEKQGGKFIWEDNDVRKKRILQEGVLKTKDDIDFKNVTEIYNLFGHNVQNLRRCFVKLNSTYKLWVPYLAVTLKDGTIKTKNGFENTLNEDWTIITEVKQDMTEQDKASFKKGAWNDDGFKRIIFMHIKDNFGIDRVKFLGVFEAFEQKLIDGRYSKLYRRVATEIKISDCKK